MKAAYVVVDEQVVEVFFDPETFKIHYVVDPRDNTPIDDLTYLDMDSIVSQLKAKHLESHVDQL